MEIPREIYGAEFSEKEILNLQKGKLSKKKEFYINGELKEGKIKLEGERIYFLLEKKELEIPDKILDKKLTEEEKLRLAQGKEIQLDPTTSIAVDKELNRVIVKSKLADENKVPSKIGGYKLTESEKQKLAAGEKLETRVFKGQYGYFTANVKLTDDRKGVEFSNVKGLKRSEVDKYIEKYNNNNEVKAITGEPEKKQEIQQTKAISLDNFKDKDERTLAEAIRNNDYDKINELVKNGVEVKDKHIELAKQKNGIEKIAVLTALGVEKPKEIEIKPDKKEEKNKDKAQNKEKGQSKERTAHHVKSIIDTGFSNM